MISKNNITYILKKNVDLIKDNISNSKLLNILDNNLMNKKNDQHDKNIKKIYTDIANVQISLIKKDIDDFIYENLLKYIQNIPLNKDKKIFSHIIEKNIFEFKDVIDIIIMNLKKNGYDFFYDIIKISENNYYIILKINLIINIDEIFDENNIFNTNDNYYLDKNLLPSLSKTIPFCKKNLIYNQKLNCKKINSTTKLGLSSNSCSFLKILEFNFNNRINNNLQKIK